MSRVIYAAACLGPDGMPIGAYKFGCTTNVPSRLKSVSQTLPFSLDLAATMPGGFFLEACTHLHLRQHAIRGEYFRMSAETDGFVRRMGTGRGAFYYISDDGTDISLPANQRVAIQAAFMEFHGVTIAEGRAFLGLAKREVEARPAYYTTRLMAATALIASNRGYFVRWPHDALSALVGVTHYSVRPLQLQAAA